MIYLQGNWNIYTSPKHQLDVINGIVLIYHEIYKKLLEIDQKVEAYLQNQVLKKTLEAISFDRRRGFDEQGGLEEDPEVFIEHL